MTEITIDMVVQDRDGCLTVSGPLRLLEQVVSTLAWDPGRRSPETSDRDHGRSMDVKQVRAGDAA